MSFLNVFEILELFWASWTSLGFMNFLSSLIFCERLELFWNSWILMSFLNFYELFEFFHRLTKPVFNKNPTWTFILIQKQHQPKPIFVIFPYRHYNEKVVTVRTDKHTDRQITCSDIVILFPPLFSFLDNWTMTISKNIDSYMDNFVDKCWLSWSV